MSDYVFEELCNHFPGKVMLKPSAELYYRYSQDNQIVIERVPSQTPKGVIQPWQSRLEKILVDILTDKLISRIVPDSEKSAITAGMLNEYTFDKGVMMTYAKRKGAVKKLCAALDRYSEGAEAI